MNDYKLSLYKDSIFICGFMGTGKSTVGKKLAELLEKDFFDLDQEIVNRAGMSIPEIFEQKGEEEFRKLEWKALYDLTQKVKGVIALGGGSLQNQHIIDHLKLYGLLIFLDTPFATILDRIFSDTNRPLLLDDEGNPKSKEQLTEDLNTLMQNRLPYYSQAQISIASDQYSNVDELVIDLKKKIARYV